MTYNGPERRRADRLQEPANEYDGAYALACRAAVNWTPARLIARLWVLTRALPYYEDTWGEVDALTDLLSKHRRLVWTGAPPER